MKLSIPQIAILTLISGASLLSGCSLFTPEADKKVSTAKAPPKKVEDKFAVKITPELAQAVVKHEGQNVSILRIQDEENRVSEDFAKTSRVCPPFCIKPATLGHGVETVGELEVIDYAVKQSKGAKSILLVDARSPEWLKLGTIPGSVNIPYSRVNRAKGAIDDALEKAMKQLGVTKTAKGWNFKKAKTIVLFSNGMWCDQAPSAVAGLLKEGYPARKMKWYRGGLQSWEILGLTTVKPKPKEQEL
jgi:rhodanese-related sulfurtransferase